MFKTKCILTKPCVTDGTRISVMSRHTLVDGVTPDIRITQTLYDIHCKNLAPPDILVGAFYRGELSFKQYSYAYRMYLQQKDYRKTLRSIAKYGLVEDITFLCIEDLPEYCHRLILLQECLWQEPALHYIIS